VPVQVIVGPVQPAQREQSFVAVKHSSHVE
jgi:hypothetical protein